jgi:hypothetical protein
MLEESTDSHPEIPYTISQEEVNTFRRITRAYTRKIGALPLTPLLPRRRRMVKPVVSTPEHTFIHTVEYLVDFALIEIEQPLGLILDTPVVTPPASNYSEPEDSRVRRRRI